MIKKTVFGTLLAASSAAGIIAGVGGAYLITLRIDSELAKRRRNKRLVMRNVQFL